MSGHIDRLDATCPLCGSRDIRVEYIYGWYALCYDCYDGAPDAGPQMLVSANSREELGEEWDDVTRKDGDRGNS